MDETRRALLVSVGAIACQTAIGTAGATEPPAPKPVEDDAVTEWLIEAYRRDGATFSLVKDALGARAHQG